MLQHKLILAITLFLIGLVGVFSILTMEIPLPPEAEAILKDHLSPLQIKFVTLINPTIMLIIAVIAGIFSYDKVNLRVSIIENLIGIKNDSINPLEIAKYGIMGGIISGILLTAVGLIFNPVLPLEFKELGESFQPTLAARFLYGGLTEEIIMRFGLMTLIVWICKKIFSGTKPFVYWIGILFSAIIFALGHFPIAFQAIDNPSYLLLTYLLIGNSIGGIIFGWLYWKKGLESAFIGHIFTHIILVMAEPLLI